MIRKLALLCLIAGMIQGCQGVDIGYEFKGADRRDLPPIKVGGTTYKVFELSRSTKAQNPTRKDTGDTFAVYVEVGPGKTIYCGTNLSDCWGAIREFNRKPYRAKKNRNRAKKEVLDGM